MPKVLMVSICCLLFSIAQCWKDKKEIPVLSYKKMPIPPKAFKKDGGDLVYLPKEKLARFPGCETDALIEKEKADCAEQEMFRYLYTSFKYPKILSKRNFSGNIITKFIITEKGTVEGIEISKGGPPAINQEIFRVINSMPQWIPAKQQDEDIQVKFTIPFRIRHE